MNISFFSQFFQQKSRTRRCPLQQELVCPGLHMEPPRRRCDSFSSGKKKIAGQRVGPLQIPPKSRNWDFERLSQSTPAGFLQPQLGQHVLCVPQKLCGCIVLIVFFSERNDCSCSESHFWKLAWNWPENDLLLHRVFFPQKVPQKWTCGSDKIKKETLQEKPVFCLKDLSSAFSFSAPRKIIICVVSRCSMIDETNSQATQ